jgi:hypothetical protein
VPRPGKREMEEADMRYVLITRTCYKDDPWSIHRAHCSDVERDLRANGGYIEGSFHSIDEAVASVVEDLDMIEMGYGAESIRIYPCVKSR